MKHVSKITTCFNSTSQTSSGINCVHIIYAWWSLWQVICCSNHQVDLSMATVIKQNQIAYFPSMHPRVLQQYSNFCQLQLDKWSLFDRLQNKPMHLQQNRKRAHHTMESDISMNIFIHIHCSTNTAVTIEQEMHSKNFYLSHSPTRALNSTPDKHHL